MKYKYYKLKLLSFFILFGCVYKTANADLDASSISINSFEDFIKNVLISGDIRSYYFIRDYSNPNTTDQATYSLGGELRVLTPAILGGFQLGASLYTAQDLGLNSDNSKAVDKTLPPGPLTVLGQAYLQYSNSKFLVRGGDQLINTPWMNAADSRMIPNTFRGIYASWTPQQNLSFIAMRMFDFKSRTSDTFNGTNLYNPENPGGTAISGLQGETFSGAQAVAMTYKNHAFNSQLWAYQFFDFAKLLYGDLQYTFNQQGSLHPFIGAQFVKEWGDGDNVLEQESSGAADATALGAQLGLENERFRLALSYNKIFSVEDAYNNGDIVSPYTTGYASDPLYTTSMLGGLVEKSTGDAVKIAGTLFALNKQLQFTSSFAQYFTEPNTPNTNETDFDITYTFSKSSHLSGLSIRNRLGFLNGTTTGDNYSDRLMLQFNF